MCTACREEEESLVRIMKLGEALRALAEQLSADPDRPGTAHGVAAAIGNGTTAEVRHKYSRKSLLPLPDASTECSVY